MSLLLNDEQRMLRESAQQFLAAQAPVEALRRLRADADPLGYDPALWRQVVELGWSGIVFPERYGGLDFGYKGLGAVFEQTGRSLAVTPLLSSVVLGGSLLLDAGSDAQRDAWLPRIAAGEALLALALEEEPRHDPARVATIARRDGERWRLDGAKWFVLDGQVAERIVVVARSAGERGDVAGLSLFLLDPTLPGVTLERTRMLDSRNAARLRLEGVQLPAEALLGEAGAGLAPLERALDRARICLAAEALGVVGEAFDRSVAYLKERVQFDVPIGSFQALQHRAARLYVELELLKSCVAAALEALDAGSVETPALASLAKARTCDFSERALNECVQMHGGIGVTDELDIGLFLKRGRVIQQSFGDAVFHRRRFARLKGLQE